MTTPSPEGHGKETSTGEILEAIGLVSDRLGELAAQQRRDRIKFWIAGAVAVAVGAAGIGVGLAAHATGTDIQASTRETRVASCLQFNVAQGLAVNAERQEIRKLVAAMTAGDRSAQTTARVRDFLKDYDQTVIAEHPLRDCTPDGIAAYLKGPTTGATTTSTIPLIP